MENIANMYANALVSIAKDERKLEEYKLVTLNMQNIFSENPKLLKLLKSYFVKDDKKEEIINEVTKEFELPNFTNFIKLLTQKHKINMFKDIAKQINKGLNFELDIYEGFVYSTEPLSEDKISEITDAISKRIGKRCELVNKIDFRLIGGTKVVVHDHIFDGSIKYKLETMKENLKERRTANED